MIVARGNYTGGSLRYYSDGDGKVSSIDLPHRLYAHQMIEESMLAANVCAANFMHKHYKFGVYRVHEKPEELKLESLKSFFGE